MTGEGGRPKSLLVVAALNSTCMLINANRVSGTTTKPSTPLSLASLPVLPRNADCLMSSLAGAPLGVEQQPQPATSMNRNINNTCTSLLHSSYSLGDGDGSDDGGGGSHSNNNSVVDATRPPPTAGHGGEESDSSNSTLAGDLGLSSGWVGPLVSPSPYSSLACLSHTNTNNTVPSLTFKLHSPCSNFPRTISPALYRTGGRSLDARRRKVGRLRKTCSARAASNTSVSGSESSSGEFSEDSLSGEEDRADRVTRRLEELAAGWHQQSTDTPDKKEEGSANGRMNSDQWRECQNLLLELTDLEEELRQLDTPQLDEMISQLKLELVGQCEHTGNDLLESNCSPQSSSTMMLLSPVDQLSDFAHPTDSAQRLIDPVGQRKSPADFLISPSDTPVLPSSDQQYLSNQPVIPAGQLFGDLVADDSQRDLLIPLGYVEQLIAAAPDLALCRMETDSAESCDWPVDLPPTLLMAPPQPVLAQLPAPVANLRPSLPPCPTWRSRPAQLDRTVAGGGAAVGMTSLWIPSDEYSGKISLAGSPATSAASKEATRSPRIRPRLSRPSPSPSPRGLALNKRRSMAAVLPSTASGIADRMIRQALGKRIPSPPPSPIPACKSASVPLSSAQPSPLA